MVHTSSSFTIKFISLYSANATTFRLDSDLFVPFISLLISFENHSSHTQQQYQKINIETIMNTRQFDEVDDFIFSSSSSSSSTLTKTSVTQVTALKIYLHMFFLDSKSKSVSTIPIQRVYTTMQYFCELPTYQRATYYTHTTTPPFKSWFPIRTFIALALVKKNIATLKRKKQKWTNHQSA